MRDWQITLIAVTAALVASAAVLQDRVRASCRDAVVRGKHVAA